MSAAPAPPRWVLRLYVVGASARSSAAIEIVRQVCDEELPGQVELEVIDVRREPAMVVADHIIATPTLIKQAPPPLRRLIGDLSDPQRVRDGLDVTPRPERGEPT